MRQARPRPAASSPLATPCASGSMPRDPYLCPSSNSSRPATKAPPRRCPAATAGSISQRSLDRLAFTMAATFAELELAYRHVAEGAQRVADQRRRVAEQVRAGRDARLSMRVLETFQDTQHLLL